MRKNRIRINPRRRWGFRRGSKCGVSTNERVERKGVGEEENEKAKEKDREGEEERDFAFLNEGLE